MVLNDCLVLWLQLKGQCQDSALVGGITAVLEQGTPVQMIQLLQSPWEERFRVRTSTWPPPLPPHLLWSVNQEFPTHSPPQGIPGAGGGWKFSGLTEALSPNHLSLIKYSEGQMSVSDILASCETEQYLAVCGTDGGSDTRLQESRSGLLKCLAHQRQVLHVCALWFF